MFTSPLKTVAIVGRPNVGKSRLFNRLIGRRVSIVHDQPGVTRDVIAEEVDQHFILMDTGGIGMADANDSSGIDQAMHEQVAFAIQAADAIIFVVDGFEGCTTVDVSLTQQLRTYDKPIILAVNKVDHFKHANAPDAFYELNLGTPIAISAEHGSGITELMDAITQHIGPAPEQLAPNAKEMRVGICFAGRPNVGKSSLGNALLKTERLIVSDVPGTTRDSVEMDLDYVLPNDEVLRFRLMDTAGLRPKNKVHTAIEHWAAMRTQDAIAKSDIVLLVIDAREGVTNVDKKLAGQIAEAGKGLIVVVNKWDLAMELFKSGQMEGYETLQAFREGFAAAIRKELFSLPESPILFTSALEGYAIDSILRQSARLYERLMVRLSTNKLNKAIAKLVMQRVPASVSGKRFKVYYSVQISHNPIRIRLYCNQIIKLDPPYKRYLESGLNEVFDLQGCPIGFDTIGKPKRPPAPNTTSRTSHRTSGKRVTNKRPSTRRNPRGGR